MKAGRVELSFPAVAVFRVSAENDGNAMGSRQTQISGWAPTVHPIRLRLDAHSRKKRIGCNMLFGRQYG